MSDIHTQLQNALQKKKDLTSELQKLQGKLEIAKQQMEQVEKECEELGVDPNNLDEIIDDLTERYEQSVLDFVNSINALDTKLQQYRNP